MKLSTIFMNIKKNLLSYTFYYWQQIVLYLEKRLDDDKIINSYEEFICKRYARNNLKQPTLNFTEAQRHHTVIRK